MLTVLKYGCASPPELGPLATLTQHFLSLFVALYSTLHVFVRCALLDIPVFVRFAYSTLSVFLEAFEHDFAFCGVAFQ